MLYFINLIHKQQIKNIFTFSEPSHPDNIDVSYRILCPNATSWKKSQLRCNNVEINSEVSIIETVLTIASQINAINLIFI